MEVPTTLQNKFQNDHKGKRKSCAAGDLDNKRTERTPHKCFRCGSEDNLIAKCPNPPKGNDKQKRNYVLLKELIVNL